MVKWLRTLLIVQALALALTACAPAPDAQPAASVQPTADSGETAPGDTQLYQLSNGLTVGLPADVMDDVLVETPEEGNSFFSVYDRRSFEAGGGHETDMGWIFSLARYDQVSFEESLVTDSSGRTYIGRQGDWYYAWLFPTDVRFYSEDEDQTQALAVWEELNRRLPEEILSDFLSRNGLETFDESQIYHDGCLWDSQHVYVRYEGAESATLLLSQPARQGQGGIWCVEGLFENGFGVSVRVLPLNTGLPAADYYAELQEEADGGQHAGLLTPEGAALDWLAGRYDGVTSGQITLVEGEPAWNLMERVLGPILNQEGELRQVRYENGAETQTAEYGGGYAFFELLSGWPWLKAEAPSSVDGPAMVYEAASGGKLIFLAGGNLTGVEQDGEISWYRPENDSVGSIYDKISQSLSE